MLATPPAKRSGTLSGHVADDHDLAAAGAVVVLEPKASGLRRIVKSSVRGHFTHAPWPPNDDPLTVRAAGYSTVKRDLALSSGQGGGST